MLNLRNGGLGLAIAVMLPFVGCGLEHDSAPQLPSKEDRVPVLILGDKYSNPVLAKAGKRWVKGLEPQGEVYVVPAGEGLSDGLETLHLSLHPRSLLPADLRNMGPETLDDPKDGSLRDIRIAGLPGKLSVSTLSYRPNPKVAQRTFGSAIASSRRFLCVVNYHGDRPANEVRDELEQFCKSVRNCGDPEVK